MSLFLLAKSENFKFWAIRSNLVLVLFSFLLPVVVSATKSLVVIASAPGRLPSEAALDATIGTFGLPLLFVSGTLGLRIATDDFAQSAINLTRLAVISPYKMILSKCLVLLFWSCGIFSIGITFATGAALVLLKQDSSISAVYALLPQISIGISACLLVATIGFAIGCISSTGLGAGLHFTALFALVPVLVTILVGKNSNLYTSFLPTSGFQASFTWNGATPVTLEGVPPSIFTQGQGLLVLGVWAICFSFLAFAFGYRFPNRKLKLAANSRRHKNRNHLSGTWPSISSNWVSELYKASTIRATWIFVFVLVSSFIAVGRIAALQNPLSNVLTDPKEGRFSLELDAFSYQTLSLTASAGFSQVLLALFGCFVCLIEANGKGETLTLRANPNRYMVWVAKICSLGTAIFLLLALTGFFTTAALTPLESSFGFPIEAFSEPAIICILAYSFGGTCCFLIGFSLANVLKSAIASVSASIGLIVIAPSVLGSFGTSTLGTSYVWIYNLHSYFPYLPGAVRWLAPNEVTPQIVNGGMIQMVPMEQMLVIVLWTLALLLASAFSFRYRASRL